MRFKKIVPSVALALAAVFATGQSLAAPQPQAKAKTSASKVKKVSAKKVTAKRGLQSRRVAGKADFVARKSRGAGLSVAQAKRSAGRAAKIAQTVGAHGLAAAGASSIVFDAEKEPVDGLGFSSSVVLVQDAITGTNVMAKNPGMVAPIASITKLMTAYVTLESGLSLDEVVTISSDDVDRLKGTSSRLEIGQQLTRKDLLHLALMSSENRAAAALGRSYPAGFDAFVAKMNETAKRLGMSRTHYVDTTGLSAGNTSTAEDLAKLVRVAVEVDLIREYSTDVSGRFDVNHREADVMYRNTNSLVRQGDWQIALQKTGYTSSAGRCVVMYAFVDDRPYVMVLLDAPASSLRVADANKIRRVLSSPSTAHGAEILRAKADKEGEMASLRAAGAVSIR